MQVTENATKTTVARFATKVAHRLCFSLKSGRTKAVARGMATKIGSGILILSASLSG